VSETDYLIPTHAVAVDVDLGDGRRITGEVFLHNATAAHGGDENILDLMNDESPFFPLRINKPKAGTVLVAKAQVHAMLVTSLAADSPRVAIERETASRFDVTIELDDGVKISGTVFVDTPPGRDRPLDFFNSAKAGFFALTQGDNDVLVNRACVQLVHDTAAQSSRPPRFI
jgi:hypothetical protein